MLRKRPGDRLPAPNDYSLLVSGISDLLERSRRTAVRSVNSILTATYWEVGRRMVEYEQGGKTRSVYGAELLDRLSRDLTAKCGRGFSRSNVAQMRTFYMAWEIVQTPSGQFEARVKSPTLSKDLAGDEAPATTVESVPASTPDELPHAFADVFPLSWSQYVRLMSVEKLEARAFYESEAIRGGWSVRQLDRQISTQFFERVVGSKRPHVLLARGQIPKPEDALPVDVEVRDPCMFEFLNLKDEYSETELEEALIRRLEWFLLEMGTGFTFVARQKRIRIGGSWYRIDLLLYHRGLRCLVVIDLKIGALTHADTGQMALYLNYARERLAMPGEAEPVGIILCSDKDDAVVKYATGGIRARVFASKYLTSLPDEETLRQEIRTAKQAIQARQKEEKVNGQDTRGTPP